jgi:hypothetical protein
MKKRSFAPVFACVLIVLAGCQAAARASSAPSAADASSQSSLIPVSGGVAISENADAMQPFSSPRYGYAIAYPKGWQLTQESGFWEYDQALYPGNPGTDTYLSPDGRQSLVIGHRALLDGATLESYVQAGLNQIRQQFFTCGDPKSNQAVTVGGGDGQLFSYRCTDGYWLMIVFAVRGRDGLTVTWQSPQGTEALDQARFQRMIASLRFTPK